MRIRAFTLLLALSLLAGCAALRPPLAVAPGAEAALRQADWTAARRMDVTLESFDFLPDTLELVHGRPYVLHLENTSSGGHNFDAPEFFAAAALAEGPVERRLSAGGGVIEVGAGQGTEIRLIPLKPGTYRVICSHPLHESFGMEGKIIVK